MISSDIASSEMIPSVMEEESDEEEEVKEERRASYSHIRYTKTAADMRSGVGGRSLCLKLESVENLNFPILPMGYELKLDGEYFKQGGHRYNKHVKVRLGRSQRENNVILSYPNIQRVPQGSLEIGYDGEHFTVRDAFVTNTVKLSVMEAEEMKEDYIYTMGSGFSFWVS